MQTTIHCYETGAGADTGSTSVTVNKPTSASSGPSPKNAAVGDLLLIFVSSDDTGAGPDWDNSTNKPTGFTFINTAGDGTSDAHCAAFWKIVDGTEGTSFTVPCAVTMDQAALCVLISGAATAQPHLTGADVIDSTPPIAITGVTATDADTLAFAVSAYDGGDSGGMATSGTGWAELAEYRNGTGSGNSEGCVSYRQMSGTGATGTCTHTPTTGDGMAGFQFAISPHDGYYTTPPVATATGAVLVPDVEVVSLPLVDADIAEANAAVVTTSASIAVELFPPIATATGAVLEHDVSAEALPIVTQTSPIAATGDVLVPTLTLAPSVNAEIATASAAVLTPTITVASYVEAVLATAAAVVLSVGLGTGVAAPISTATADVLVPTITVSPQVEASIATATGDVPVHTVQSGIEVQAAIATATADALVAGVSAGVGIPATIAAATGDVLVPDVESGGTNVQAEIATATAEVVTADASIEVTLYADIAAATGAIPEHTAEVTIVGANAVPATATGAVLVPTLTLAPNIGAAIATATGELPSGGAHVAPTATVDTKAAATGDVLVATVTSVVAGDINATIATASADVLVPALTLAPSVSASIATATGEVLVPGVQGDTGVAATIATATGAVLVPTIANVIYANVQAEAARASAAVLKPGILPSMGTIYPYDSQITPYGGVGY